MSGRNDDILMAAVKMVERTGATNVTIGFSEEHDPAVWFAVADFPGRRYEAAGGMSPLRAVLRLLDTLIDGGQCKHCKKPTGVTVDPGTMPLKKAICWYQYDPELKTFRRGCE